EDDAPPQQLRIEDMTQRLTETPETEETAQASEAAQEPQTAEMIGESPEVSEEATEETPEISEEVIEEAAEVPEEAIADAPETPDTASETRIAARELMLAEYPFILTARRSQKRKASPRKPKRLAGLFRKRRKKARKRRNPPLSLRDISPKGGDIETNVACNRSPALMGRGTGGRASRNAPRRKRRETKRLAETFRTRRKRPGRKARKRRRIARPKRNAPEVHDGVPQITTPPKTCENTATPPKATRRKLSGKAVRRCLHCLLFGCWLSWPFC
ncbi:MAG: hypothetical protein IJK52_10705, partial [Oscillospiraceae bacterium]|nr:hypothetical protein [Oscillospiraceae bacterium]